MSKDGWGNSITFHIIKATYVNSIQDKSAASSLLVQPACSPGPANRQPGVRPRPTHVKSVGLSMDLTVKHD